LGAINLKYRPSNLVNKLEPLIIRDIVQIGFGETKSCAGGPLSRKCQPSPFEIWKIARGVVVLCIIHFKKKEMESKEASQLFAANSARESFCRAFCEKHFSSGANFTHANTAHAQNVFDDEEKSDDGGSNHTLRMQNILFI
jgi:hypothetical protein